MNLISSHIKSSANTATARLAELAAKKVAEERAKAVGMPSGKSMMIMAGTLKVVQRFTRTKTARRWVKVVAVVAAVAAMVVAAMGVVTARPKRQIGERVSQRER